MMFETAGQANVFLAMVYAGLLVGLGYDLLRGLRRLTAANAWWTGLLDLLFWLVAALVVAAALALRSEDGLRLYALAGVACGAVLYALGISALLRALGQGLKKLMKRLAESRLAHWGGAQFSRLKAKRQPPAAEE